MGAVLADTHAILWYVTADARLSRAAAVAMDAATAAGDPVYVSAISLVEVLYLVEKGRLSADDRRIVIEAIEDARNPARLVPVDRSVLEHARTSKPPGCPRHAGPHYCRHGARAWCAVA